ncbi:3-isopropylmalate dehydratase small subunit [Paraburkholderia pallida]|uniref:3-isopropylmalate dehydratase small subunit n=1 Tax=Paraburkholderia pallida TaxID=2547399 RepID=A0A4P7D4S6_9BURK|nr:3-isopropylmalate dehydratase small subunit [Paraburkholderia pallida]QBR01564.1 3-isopropylmalate dehydratase small subunit [Paraburkholderia pallida]
MDKVTAVAGIVAPLLRDNVDTDIVIRIERLTQQTREALGHYAFEAWRYHEDGTENPAFVLNRAPWRGAPVLLAGANFGCGSSREGAVWALMSMGIRCVIAESFGEIFYNNCFQNGLLPVRLAKAQLQTLADLAQTGASVKVDLVAQQITADDLTMPFEIEGLRRDALLQGLDEISQTLQLREAIRAWQRADREARPWIWSTMETARTGTLPRA